MRGLAAAWALCVGGGDALQPSHHWSPGLGVEEEQSFGHGALSRLFCGQMNRGFVFMALAGTFRQRYVQTRFKRKNKILTSHKK